MNYNMFNSLFKIQKKMTLKNVITAITDSECALCYIDSKYYVEAIDIHFGEDDNIPISKEIGDKIRNDPAVITQVLDGTTIYRF